MLGGGGGGGGGREGVESKIKPSCNLINSYTLARSRDKMERLPTTIAYLFFKIYKSPEIEMVGCVVMSALFRA